MYILGLNIGHNATACLLKDGKIISCASEERFSRIKNHSGIPFKSIKFLLDSNGINMPNLDIIVLDDHYCIDKDPYFGRRFLEAYTKKGPIKRAASYLGYKYPKIFDIYKKYKEKSQKSNKPRFIAKLKDVSFETIVNQTTKNTNAIFQLYAKR